MSGRAGAGAGQGGSNVHGQQTFSLNPNAAVFTPSTSLNPNAAVFGMSTSLNPNAAVFGMSTSLNPNAAPFTAVNSNAAVTNSSAAITNSNAVVPNANAVVPNSNFNPAVAFNPPVGINFNQIFSGLHQPAPATANNPAIDRPDRIVVCVVCGVPCEPTVNCALHPDGQVFQSWMNPVLIKAKPEWQHWKHQRKNAKAYGHGHFELLDWFKKVSFYGGADGFSIEGVLGAVTIDTSKPEMFIPLHQDCLEMAIIFCKYQSRFDIDFRQHGGGAPSSIAHFYEIWQNRAIASYPGAGPMKNPIKEGNGYFGAPVARDLVAYKALLDSDPAGSWRFLARPTDIGHVFNLAIRPFLQPIQPGDMDPTPERAELWARCRGLPSELFNRIVEAVEPFDDLTKHELKPTRVLPPQYWKLGLLCGRLVPWLWDLLDGDDDVAADIEASDNWDWELVCRLLAQPDVFDEGGILHDLSDGLWNRYRIWKLLNAARLGHVSFD